MSQKHHHEPSSLSFPFFIFVSFHLVPVHVNIIEANYDVNNKRISKNFISCMAQ